MDGVALKTDLGSDLLFDRPPDSACLRVPLDVIPDFEVASQWNVLALLGALPFVSMTSASKNNAARQESLII